MHNELRWYLKWLKNKEDMQFLSVEIAKEKQRETDGVMEVNELGIIVNDKVTNVDKGVIANLWRTFSSIVSEYLRLYNKENLKSNNSLVYKKALYPNAIFVDEEEKYLGTIEELDKWANLIEETANKFDNLLGYEPFQEDVNNAFDMLKKIFLGLWLI